MMPRFQLVLQLSGHFETSNVKNFDTALRDHRELYDHSNK